MQKHHFWNVFLSFDCVHQTIMEELRGFNLDKLYRKLFLPDAEFIASTPKKTDRADDSLQAREICFMGAESL